jgi:hypothetical protein
VCDELQFVALKTIYEKHGGGRKDKLKFVGPVEQNHSILLTIAVCFVSYSGRFSRPSHLFLVCPAFSSLNL